MNFKIFEWMNFTNVRLIGISYLQRIMDAHQGQSNRCVELGNQLIHNEHFAASEIRKNVTKLEDLWSCVEQEWSGKKELLEQGLELQVCTEKYFVEKIE